MLPVIPCCGHAKLNLLITSGNDVIQLIDRFGSFKDYMCGALLNILDCKHPVLVAVAVPVLMNMIAEASGNVGAGVRRRLAVNDHRQALKASPSET